jgi:hypothetical protein
LHHELPPRFLYSLGRRQGDDQGQRARREGDVCPGRPGGRGGWWKVSPITYIASLERWLAGSLPASQVDQIRQLRDGRLTPAAATDPPDPPDPSHPADPAAGPARAADRRLVPAAR